MADERTTVTINLDGVDIQVESGQTLIDAAQMAGTYIPRFCYHPRMNAVGLCRACLVEVEGPRGTALVPSCTTPVGEGMIVHTQSETAKKAQAGVLEFLLINHPLDCPVCDKGGECPLQDQAFAFGAGETRFVEEKRHINGTEVKFSISRVSKRNLESTFKQDKISDFEDYIYAAADKLRQ